MTTPNFNFPKLEFIEADENDQYIMSDDKCNFSFGVLEGILNTKDGKELGGLYENHVKPFGPINVEEAVREMRRGLV